MPDPRPKTLFLDIDGTLLEHPGTLSQILLTEQLQPRFLFGVEPLPGVREKLDQWNAQGHRIILTTGRPESMRAFTQQQLDRAGIFYDQLVMGITGGERVLINDRKPSGEDTARAINVDRNVGLEGVEL